MKLDLSRAVSYHYDLFPPDNIDVNQFIEELLEATAALAKYDQMLKGLHNSELLLAPLRNQEAILSSRMEGTISTMDEILKYTADENSESHRQSHYRPDVIETILYQRGLRNAQDAITDGYKLSGSMIKSIHQQLLSMGRGAQKSPGKFKTEQNYLADRNKNSVLFIPISPEKLQDGIDLLFDYIENHHHPLLIKTAVMHLEFEALHPFQDGNGRIGRMLITLLLWSKGLISEPHFYISAFLEENKDSYIDSMRAVSKIGDWNSWCAFFLKAVAAQAHKNLEVAESIQSLYEKMKLVFSEKLSSKWSVQALDYIFTYPIFRNNNFTAKSGIPPATAQRFTRTLIEENIIITLEESSGRRPGLYSFEPLMELVRV